MKHHRTEPDKARKWKDKPQEPAAQHRLAIQRIWMQFADVPISRDGNGQNGGGQ